MRDHIDDRKTLAKGVSWAPYEPVDRADLLHATGCKASGVEPRDALESVARAKLVRRVAN